MKNTDRIEIPFRYENHFILIDLIFNERLPLTFIFDTGAENTIITQRQVTDMLGIRYEKEFRIIGSDMRTELIAYLVQNIEFRMSALRLRRQQALVLDDDYFRFEEYTGTKVHGILGANIFRHYVVKIDYRRRIITLQKPNTFKPPGDDFLEAPLEISKNKPYLRSEVKLAEGRHAPVKLLLDTGASLALLFNLGTHPDIRLPENAIPGNIGKGLGGYLEGYLG
ncbi:MAG: clan AA aspartic protease, partial [Phaeodactylibacter sp.]|nr:clan AA aspartic protease [Phaeodactylibacter sp.]